MSQECSAETPEIHQETKSHDAPAILRLPAVLSPRPPAPVHSPNDAATAQVASPSAPSPAAAFPQPTRSASSPAILPNRAAAISSAGTWPSASYPTPADPPSKYCVRPLPPH